MERGRAFEKEMEGAKERKKKGEKESKWSDHVWFCIVWGEGQGLKGNTIKCEIQMHVGVLCLLQYPIKWGVIKSINYFLVDVVLSQENLCLLGAA